jgi:hypothetical protein
METRKAYKLLNISETASATEIEKAYQETINEFNARIRDAVTPTLKKKYQEELRIREEAFDTILKSNLPSQHPSFVSPKATVNNIISPQRFESKGPKNGTLIGIGIVIIILLLIILFKPFLNSPEKSTSNASTDLKSQLDSSVFPNKEKVIDSPQTSTKLPPVSENLILDTFFQENKKEPKKIKKENIRNVSHKPERTFPNEQILGEYQFFSTQENSTTEGTLSIKKNDDISVNILGNFFISTGNNTLTCKLKANNCNVSTDKKTQIYDASGEVFVKHGDNASSQTFKITNIKVDFGNNEITINQTTPSDWRLTRWYKWVK